MNDLRQLIKDRAALEYKQAIESLDRYRVEANSGSGGDCWTEKEKDKEGDWVEFTQAEELLKRIFKQ